MGQTAALDGVRVASIRAETCTQRRQGTPPQCTHTAGICQAGTRAKTRSGCPTCTGWRSSTDTQLGVSRARPVVVARVVAALNLRDVCATQCPTARLTTSRRDESPFYTGPYTGEQHPVSNESRMASDARSHAKHTVSSTAVKSTSKPSGDAGSRHANS